jgi:hypothetical protein
MEVSAEAPPPVEEGHLLFDNAPPVVSLDNAPDTALRKRRIWKVPLSPRTSTARVAEGTTSSHEDAVIGALQELRREHGLILEEILRRLPHDRGGEGGRLSGHSARAGFKEPVPAKLVELKPKDTTGSGRSPRQAGNSLHETTDTEHKAKEQHSATGRGSIFSARGEPMLFHHLKKYPGDHVHRGLHPFMHWLVHHPAFDLFFGALILINTIEMGIEEQILGAQKGYDLGVYTYYGSPEWSRQYFPEGLFDASDAVFACIFTIEVALRLSGTGWHFFRRPVEVFDLGVVILSDISVVLNSTGTHWGLEDVELLRLLRAVKLLRLLKLVRAIEGFDALHLMLTALQYSAWALCWSVLLLMSIMTFCAMITTNGFRALYLEDGNNTLSDDNKEELFLYWGTFSRSMLSLFELALANWTPICRWLMENLHEGFMLFALVFKLVMGIAVVGVINAVFMQETFKVANTDDEIMVRTKTRAARQHVDKMQVLFRACDEDNNGRIHREEFRRVLEDRSIRTWLASMDLLTSDSDILFDLLRGDDETIDHNELVHGINHLKGAARSIDMRALLRALHAEGI